MKRTIIAALLCTFVPLAFANDTPGTVPKPKPRPPVKTVPGDTTNTNTAIGNGGFAYGGYVGNVQAGASVAGITAGNQLAITQEAAAYAPDVISYPTAPCRVAIGASGGWFGGAIGFSGSSLDEACSRIETSRHLHNLGMRDASQQIMCLSDEARQALEATGFKCLIKAQAPQEPVKP